MAITEAQATESIRQIKRKVNRFLFNRLVEKLFSGVVLTDEHMSNALEIIYNYFHNNGAGYLIKDIVLKTMYRKEKDEPKIKIKSWLETMDGGILNQCEMFNLQYRILY